RRRDEEHERRVVRRVARRPDDEELRDRGGRAEDQEGGPVLRVLKPAEEGKCRGRRRDRDEEEVDARVPRQAVVASRRLRRQGDLGRNCAHSFLCSFFLAVRGPTDKKGTTAGQTARPALRKTDATAGLSKEHPPFGEPSNDSPEGVSRRR